MQGRRRHCQSAPPLPPITFDRHGASRNLLLIFGSRPKDGRMSPFAFHHGAPSNPDSSVLCTPKNCICSTSCYKHWEDSHQTSCLAYCFLPKNFSCLWSLKKSVPLQPVHLTGCSGPAEMSHLSAPK